MKSLLAVFITTLSFSAAAEFGLPEAKDPAKEFRCWKQMGQQLEQDGVGGKWRAKIAPNMTFRYVAPSSRLGRWWIAEKSEQHEILVKETPYDRMVFRYKLSDCAAEVAQLKFPAKKEVGFTDALLAKTVQDNKSGLVYSWSSGMGFSEIGLKAIKEAAAATKQPLTIITDPNVDEKSARRLLTKAGIKDVKFIPNNSKELRFRNALMHFPNLVMYKDGKIVDVIVPGVMGTEQYTQVIKQYLE